MKKIYIIALCALLAPLLVAEAQKTKRGKSQAITCPIAERGERWKLDPQFSDEFNAEEIDEKKWFYKMGTWGVRSWAKDCVNQVDGKLKLTMRYEEHENKSGKFFYRVGIARSTATTTYGYYEARIKAASLYPGVCPAFWLYSSGEKGEVNGEMITYNEIDIVELTQGEAKNSTVSTIDCNLHMRLIRDGKEVWQRPNTHPELCKTNWEAPWDPRDDFHIYACENRPDSIIFYVDNKRIGAKKNLYWHLPMNVTFTMEPRKPHHIYKDGDRVANPAAATPEGFPTTMEVDWVRTWKRQK